MNLTHHQKKTLCTFTLLILPIILLAIPFTQWGFKTDDWGNVYHAIMHRWQDVINLFTEGNSETVFLPSNNPGGQPAFFQGLYRPISFIYYFIQYCIFGTSPYGFLLVTVMFHALNATLLFSIFSHITTLTISFLAALFFAFHPSLWNWIGWTSAQTYFIELFVLLLIILLLLRYLTTKKFTYYLCACLLFLANIFLKEQTIFLPLWIMAACYLYKNYLKNNKHINIIGISSGFWLVSIVYTITRLQFFPLTKATGTLTFQPTWHSFITRMSSRFFDFVTYANDIFGLSWLGGGNQLLKGSIMLALLCGLAYLFVYNTQKKCVVFCALSMLLFSWPAILMHYQPRYIYLALPWSILIVVLLITFYKKPYWTESPYKLTAHIATLIISMLIAFNACFLMHHLADRQKVLHIITTAFQKLVDNPRTINRTLCFLALPQRWFHQGTTQAIWMLRKNADKPVYQFNAEINPIDGICDDNYLIFTRTKKGFLATSTNPDKIWFTLDDGKKSDQAIIIIEKQFLQDDPLFVVWDYSNQQFRILDEATL